MQTGSSETLIGWKSGKTTYVLYGTEYVERAWLWTLDSLECIQRWETEREFHYRLPGRQLKVVLKKLV